MNLSEIIIAKIFGTNQRKVNRLKNNNYYIRLNKKMPSIRRYYQRKRLKRTKVLLSKFELFMNEGGNKNCKLKKEVRKIKYIYNFDVFIKLRKNKIDNFEKDIRILQTFKTSVINNDNPYVFKWKVKNISSRNLKNVYDLIIKYGFEPNKKDF